MTKKKHVPGTEEAFVIFDETSSCVCSGNSQTSVASPKIKFYYQTLKKVLIKSSFKNTVTVIVKSK